MYNNDQNIIKANDKKNFRHNETKVKSKWKANLHKHFTTYNIIIFH